MPAKKDYTGHRFGRLIVESYIPEDRRRVMCLCACGNRKIVLRGSLTKGRTRSCGCLHREELRERRTTHRMSQTPTYWVWGAMVGRCRDKGNTSFPHYGGRGIKVCDRWLKFENFLADMGERPQFCSIERIDSDGDYGPENCKWIPKWEQALNRRNNTLLTVGDRTQSMMGWARELGISYPALQTRMLRHRDAAVALGIISEAGEV